MIVSYLHPGKVLGSRYQLEQLLGIGQFGQVWRAKKLDTTSQLPAVAVKLPLQPGVGEEMLMADAQHMLDIPSHPNLVSVFWQGRVGDFWVVEMELVNGQPLSNIMRDTSRWARVTFKDMVTWFIEIATALDHLHKNKILHGDIKPDNILLDESSNRMKITDFGTSRRLTDILLKTTRHGGAWAYQAPEIQQANERGIPSDLFSVGAVLYHMVTGKLPRATIHELLTSAPITRPRQYNANIPEKLEAIVESLLRDDPRNRIRTAQELISRLMDISEDLDEKLPEVSEIDLGSGYLDRANELIKANKFEEAREAAAQAALHSTGLATALELFARLSDKLGYSDDAIKAYQRVLALSGVGDEGRYQISLSLADILLKLHRYEEAKEYIDLSMVDKKSSYGVQFRSAIILGAYGKLEQSLDTLNELEKAQWSTGAVLEKKAWVLWLMHKYEEAAGVCRQVLEDMPDNSLCLKRLAEYEALLGNPRRAEMYRNRIEALVS